MNVNNKLRICIFANALLLSGIIVIIALCGSKESKYWRFGPNEDLVLINVHINTWNKYYYLLGVITFIKITQVIIGEIAHPIIGFNIYNPDKKNITHFTKFELQLYGNIMYFIDSVRSVLMIMLSITQIDIALFGTIICEITSIFTIRMLLNEKIFVKKNKGYGRVPETDIENPKIVENK